MRSGRRGRYRAWLETTPPPPDDELRMFAGEVRDDLIPEGTVAGLGGLPWDNVSPARAHARFRLDAPQPREGGGDGLPLVILTLPRRNAEAVATRIQAALPEGVACVPHGAGTLLVLIGETMYGLFTVASNDEALALFQQRLRASGGWHGIIVAAEGEEPPGCTVAFFEFTLDGAPPSPSHHATRRPQGTRHGVPVTIEP